MMRISSQKALGKKEGGGHPFASSLFSSAGGPFSDVFLKLFIDSPFVCGNGFSNGMTFPDDCFMFFESIGSCLG